MLRRWLILVFWLVPLPAFAQVPPVKAFVQSPGMVEVRQEQLAALGLDPAAIDPTTIAVRHRGNLVPIRVTGADDQSFDPGDAIRFYGQGIPKGDALWPITDVDVYWIHFGESAPPRMTQEAAATGTFQGVWQSTHTNHQEVNDTYYSTLALPEGSDRWGWGERIIEGSSRDTLFTADQIQAGTATVRVSLLGITDDIFFTPDHQTRIRVNGCTVDTRAWDGVAHVIQEGTIDTACLNAGTNTLSVDSLDSGASVNSVVLDWFEVSYPRAISATNDRVVFAGQTGTSHKYELVGFSSASRVDAYNVTDPESPRWLTVNSLGFGRFSIQAPFTTTVHQYEAMHDNAYAGPLGLAIATPSTLTDPANGADLILITTAAMASSLEPLAAHRRAQGLRVKVVPVGDIYDTFSYGVTDPQAIKDFLTYAYQTWAPPKPLYVLLAGDGTVNFKWQFPGGSPNYVPTHFYTTADGGTAPSDHWFVTVDGNDPIPDMFIGRLPVTPATADGTVQKIIRYESQDFSSWDKTVQLAADDVEPIFEEMNADLAAQLPASFSVDHLNIREMGGQAAGDALKDNINAGRLITTFSGHGAGYQWADENLLNADDPATLTNGDKLTFLIGLNCASGYFVQPWHQSANKLSMAESFVTEPNGGAVGMWAATWVGYSADQRKLGRTFFKVALNDGNRTLGAATTNALVAAITEGVPEGEVNAFHLFGDPSGTLGDKNALPEPPGTAGGAGATGGGGGCSATTGQGAGDALILMLLMAGVWGRARSIRFRGK